MLFRDILFKDGAAQAAIVSAISPMLKALRHQQKQPTLPIFKVDEDVQGLITVRYSALFFFKKLR